MFWLRVELADHILLIFTMFFDVQEMRKINDFAPPCKVNFAETSVFIVLYEDSVLIGTQRNIDQPTRTNYLQGYPYD